MAESDKTHQLPSYEDVLGWQEEDEARRERKRKKRMGKIVREEGDEVTFEVPPYTVVSGAIEQPTGHTGFPRGPVATGGVKRPPR